MSLGPTAYRITDRDKEIIDALVHRVRVFSIPQIARTWWPEGSPKDASRRIELLDQAGLLHLFRAISHPEITISQPVLSWTPGQASPEFGKASYQLKSRWNQPPISIKCVIATTLAGRSFGGSGGRFPRESERTHDLHMSAIFLDYRRLHPEAIPFWRSEARILWERGGSKTEKLPDAILDFPQGPTIIEFGGAYSKSKLTRFHEYCETIETPYEVW